MKTRNGFDDSGDEPPGSGRGNEDAEPPTPGQAVRITDGPFASFDGIVDSVDQEKGRIRVRVSMFGRETPIELDFLQIEKMV